MPRRDPLRVHLFLIFVLALPLASPNRFLERGRGVRRCGHLFVGVLVCDLASMKRPPEAAQDETLPQSDIVNEGGQWPALGKRDGGGLKNRSREFWRRRY